jgi:hypothetical protein
MRSRPALADVGFVLRRALVLGIEGHSPRRSGRGLWPLQRAYRLLVPRSPGTTLRGWGFKEPNSEIYLDALFEYFPNAKYIHVIRHGLDMAFSKNQQQLWNWGALYGVESPADPGELPQASLRYWVRANTHALDVGARVGARRFLAVRFDELCASPAAQAERMLRFLELEAEPQLVGKLAVIPRTPRTSGRHRGRDLSRFDRSDLQALAELGFAVEPVATDCA